MAIGQVADRCAIIEDDPDSTANPIQFPEGQRCVCIASGSWPFNSNATKFAATVSYQDGKGKGSRGRVGAAGFDKVLTPQQIRKPHGFFSSFTDRAAHFHPTSVQKPCIYLGLTPPGTHRRECVHPGGGFRERWEA
ncbi:hypothetical protein BP5796_09682 [Coleophoma crateriformis]|uniref:Uncharacterized protein n=1 Tax=Coleophoma crateriformis TaxID=565419 RepID=A0A3D8QYM9_9HELO|nr:hypothetical protein BP5796_09682 [Coleophoma crateriformis]